jgi:flagellin
MLDGSQWALQRTMNRLSSGMRINSARDDAAGLAISERMRAQSRGFDTSLHNVNNLVSMVQVADASLGSIGTNLQRIRELAVQAANDTYSAADRQALQLEANALIQASRTLQGSTTFNGHALLDGSMQLSSGESTSGAGLTLSLGSLFLAQTTDVVFRYAQMAQATTTVTPTGAVSANDLKINGQLVPASVAGSQVGQSAGSAWAVANAINQLSSTGITASANATSLSGLSITLPVGGLSAGQIVINGIPIGAGNLTGAINALTSTTGVSASATAGPVLAGFVTYTVSLGASDGRNIDVNGAIAGSAVGSVSITGPLAERPSSNLVVSGANPGSAGLSATTIAANDSGALVAVPLDEAAGYDLNPNVASFGGATSTIGIMDRKLEKLLTMRATLGAVLSVMDHRASYLSTVRDATMAAMSRITDADYAAEMADLTREQIIRTTGLAMITQANVEPRHLLSLLLTNQ